MPKLPRPTPIVQRVLAEEPEHRWHLVPLAAYLIEHDYTAEARTRIVVAAERGESFRPLIADGWLDYCDCRAVRRHVREGNRWYALYRLASQAMVAKYEAQDSAELARVERAYPVSAVGLDPDPEPKAIRALVESFEVDGPSPIAGGAMPTDAQLGKPSLDPAPAGREPWIDGPTDEDWDRVREMEREETATGGLD